MTEGTHPWNEQLQNLLYPLGTEILPKCSIYLKRRQSDPHPEPRNHPKLQEGDALGFLLLFLIDLIYRLQPPLSGHLSHLSVYLPLKNPPSQVLLIFCGKDIQTTCHGESEKGKIQSTEWEKNLADCVPDNGLFSKYIKNSYNSIFKKTNSLYKNGQRT